MPAYKNIDMMLRVKHYYEQRLSTGEIAKQISEDTGVPRTRSYVQHFIRTYKIKRKKIKLYETISTSKTNSKRKNNR